MRRQLLPALMMMIVFTVLVGIAYPLVVTGISQAAFSERANGSKLEVKETLAYDDSYKFKIFGFPKTLVFVRAKPAS